MKKGILMIITLSLFMASVIPMVLAQQCEVKVSSKDTISFLKEVSTTNQALKNCPQLLPRGLKSIFKNHRVSLIINMQKGTTESVLAIMQNGYLSGLEWNSDKTNTGYTVTMSECALDTALKNDNKFGVYAYLYLQGEVKITGSSLWKRILLGVMKPIINGQLKNAQTSVTIECSNNVITPPLAPSGKPDNCDDTYLPGHQGYAQNRELWDSYSLDTDAVCQINRGTPNSQCIHKVQLSVQGTPYYLCWYKN